MAAVTTVTEKKTKGDVLRDFHQHRSLEEVIIATSQTLVFGQVVQKTSAGQIAALGTPGNDVQTLGITGTLSAGSFTLGFTLTTGAVVWTDPIAYNANTAGIQTGIDTALGASICVASGTAITASVLTFSGTAYAGIEQPLIQINTQGLTGEEDATITHTTLGGQGNVGTAANEVQLMALAGTLASGSFTITGRTYAGVEVTTGVIAFDASTANIQTALDAAFGTNAIVAGGTALTASTLTFSGAGYVGADQDLLVIDTTLLIGCTGHLVTETTKGGPAGTADAYGVMLEAVTTTSATKKTVIAAQECTVDEDELVYTPGIRRDAMLDLQNNRRFLFQREGVQIFA